MLSVCTCLVLLELTPSMIPTDKSPKEIRYIILSYQFNIVYIWTMSSSL